MKFKADCYRAALLGICYGMSPIGAAIAQQSLPHLEQCTPTDKWNVQNGKFGVINSCDKPVVIQFMSKFDERAINLQIEPGGRFNTGLDQKQIGSGWWVFTTCPVGYISNVPFQTKYLDTLIDGHYNCVRK